LGGKKGVRVATGMTFAEKILAAHAVFGDIFGDVVTYVAFLFHPVPSTIFSIALVMLEVATPR